MSTSQKDMVEYERRRLLWSQSSLAAREASRKILGEAQFVQIEALSTGGSNGFFAAFMKWCLEPLSREE